MSIFFVLAAAALVPSEASPVKYTAFLGTQATIESIAVDGKGSAFIAGTTKAPLPVTSGSLQPEYKPLMCRVGVPQAADPIVEAPCAIPFAGKLNSDGTGFVYLTYLPIGNGEAGRIAIDARGDAWIAGRAYSADLPVTPDAVQSKPRGGAGDLFLLKLSADGARLLFATYMGGSGLEGPSGLVLDSAGNVYVAGSTDSLDLPVTAGAFQQNGLPYSGFVMKFDATGKMLYSTYFHGAPSSSTSVAAIAVDGAGATYITGTHRFGSLPVTSGAFQTTAKMSNSAYIAKLDPTGSQLVYASYLSGSGSEDGLGIAVDREGNAVVVGTFWQTLPNTPTSFPTTPGAFMVQPPERPVQGSDRTTFITKLNATGSGLVYSTLLYASESVDIRDVRIDSTGNVIVVGETTALDLSTTPGAVRQCHPTSGSWSSAGFLLALNPSSSGLVYSTYLGLGSATRVAVDSAGDAYVAGLATGGLPIVAGSFGWTASGASVLKISPVPLPSGTINCVTNGASKVSGSIAPGEIVDLFGRDIGPKQAAQGIIEAGQIGTTAGGIQVLFNGVPAPIVFADQHRIRAVVPFETGPTQLQHFGFVNVQIIGTDVPSQPAVVRTAAIAPGIFTKDGSSTGQALIANEDGTLNSRQNPARQGSVVTMYATGLIRPARRSRPVR